EITCRSNQFHDIANIGVIVQLVAPAGDFFMAVADDTPVTLISAGVGQTPMLAMLDTLAKAGHTAQVNWFHAAENGDALEQSAPATDERWREAIVTRSQLMLRLLE
ncbi:hypothetical protein ACUOCP_47125, partial [Escherichia sp. R-CC3]